jgi:hypothetical protein
MFMCYPSISPAAETWVQASHENSAYIHGIRRRTGLLVKQWASIRVHQIIFMMKMGLQDAVEVCRQGKQFPSDEQTAWGGLAGGWVGLVEYYNAVAKMIES